MMSGKPGLHPTTYLRLLFSQRAARPGDTISMRVEGTDAGAMIRGKVLRFEMMQNGDGQYAGLLIAPAHWFPAGESASFGISLEGYAGTTPLSFQVPPLLAGDYRIRLDLTRTGDGPVRERTATLYGSLRVLDSVNPSVAPGSA